MFKIDYNLSDLHFDEYFKYCDRKYNFRSHKFAIKSKFCANADQFRNFFFTRITKVWNNFPHDLVFVPNIAVFRKSLKNLNLCSTASLTFLMIFIIQLPLFSYFATLCC